MSIKSPLKRGLRTFLTVALCAAISLASIESTAIADSDTAATQSQEKKYPAVIKPVEIEPAAFVAAYERISRISAPGSEHIVSLNVEPLKVGNQETDRIKLWLGLEVGTIVAKRKAHYIDANDVTAWRGNFIGNKGFVNLVFNKEGKMIGTIWHDGNVYEIKNIKGTDHHVFYQVDPEFKKKARCGNDESFFQHQQHVMAERALLEGGKKTISSENAKEVNPSANTVIDVLICYSPEIAATITPDINTFMAALVSATNGYYTNSDVQITMNLRGSQQIAYPEKDHTLLGTALDDITAANAEFSVVPALRNSIGADLVIWLQYSKDSIPGGGRTVGIAWRPAYSVNSDYGYSVTSHWYSDSMTQTTFAHETGHNMTLAHSWVQDNGKAIYYPYGWGHYFGPGDPNTDWDYGTIMTYASTDYPYFSNPSKQVDIGGTNYDVGKAISAAYTDDAEAWYALNNIRTAIASYRATVAGGTEPENVSVTPSSGTGTSQQFQFEYSDPNGASDLKYVYGLISTSASKRANAVYFRYYPTSNQLALRNDANSAWSSATMTDVVGGKTIAPAATLSNSQVSIDTSTGSISSAGNNLTLTFTAVFKSSFAGSKNVYMYCLDSGNESDGWESMGTYTVSAPNSAPTITSITPTSGNKSSQTFVAKYTDADGITDLRYLYLKIADSSGANGGCVYLRYRRASNKIEIRSNAGGSWTQVAVVGTATTITNSQGSVDVSAVSVTSVGNTTTLSVPIVFKAPFAGTHNIYMNTYDMAYATPGWTQMGSFTVNAKPTNQSISPTSGSAAWKTFDCYFQDANGTGNLRYLYFKMSPDGSIANAVYLRYRVVTQKIDLRSDAGGSWVNGPTIGTATTIKNNQVKINCANVTATTIGNAIRLRLPLVFRAPFNGSHNTYMYSSDAQNESSGWEQMGTFLVSGATAVPATEESFSFDPGNIKPGDTIEFPVSKVETEQLLWSVNGKDLDVNRPLFTFSNSGIYDIGLLKSLPAGESELSLDNVFAGEKLIRAGDVMNWDENKSKIYLRKNYENALVLNSDAGDSSIIRINGKFSPGLRLVYNRISKDSYQFVELKRIDANSDRSYWILGEIHEGRGRIIKSRYSRRLSSDDTLAVLFSPLNNTISFTLNGNALFKSDAANAQKALLGFFETQTESLDIWVTVPEK